MAESGFGISAGVDGHEVVVGTRKWMGRCGIALDPAISSGMEGAESRGHTVVIVAIDGTVSATVSIAGAYWWRAGECTWVEVETRVCVCLRFPVRISQRCFGPPPPLPSFFQRVTDPIKDESYDAIKMFKKLGLGISMVTGDNRRAAGFVARQVGDRLRPCVRACAWICDCVRLLFIFFHPD